MRRPTTRDKAYAWWRAALAGEKPPIHHGEPQPGYYTRALIRGGPQVPCSIWLEATVDADGELTGPEILKCEIDGRPADPHEAWTWLAKRPISEADYMAMVGAAFAVGTKPAAEAAPEAPAPGKGRLDVPY